MLHSIGTYKCGPSKHCDHLPATSVCSVYTPLPPHAPSKPSYIGCIGPWNPAKIMCLLVCPQDTVQFTPLLHGCPLACWEAEVHGSAPNEVGVPQKSKIQQDGGVFSS